ncbi:MAG TPA: hypothetical protein VME46_04025 [Acidimicrobiales bacterium]|nr:hypothetical protein [Acidimicrobiales bacterium]
MTYSGRSPATAGRVVVQRRLVHSSLLWTAAAVALGAAVAACSGGPSSPTVPNAGLQPSTTAAPSGRPSSSGHTPLAEAEAYSQCMRSHGVSNFPDPVLTPSGGYGYRTKGIDPGSASFQGAVQACRTLPSPWQRAGQQLSPAQQQAWLSWAECVRANGVPNFPDPTFSGRAVQIAGSSGPGAARLQSAMDACKSRMPSTGGLGG